MSVDFLSTSKEHMAGNFGLKYHKMAHKKYIGVFGDPSYITIFRHKAGNISSHLHMFSPASKGIYVFNI